MSADRADLRCFFACGDMSAVTADPFLIFVSSEDCFAFDLLDQFSVAFFMMLFDGADHFEAGCYSEEASFSGFFGAGSFSASSSLLK